MQWWGEEVVVADGEAEELEVAPGSYFETGRVEPVNMASGEMVTRLDGPSEHLFGSIDDIPAPECSEYPSSWLDALSDLAFSPGGALIAGGGWAHALVVWDAVSGEIVHTQVDEEIFPFEDVRVAFSPDGAPRLLGGREATDSRTLIRVGRPMSSTTPQSDVSGIRTPDGSLLLDGDNFTEVAIVNTSTWTKEEPLAGQQGNFMEDIHISPNGEFVATSGFDGESWVWDLETRSVVRKWAVDGCIRLVAYLDDDSLLIVPDRAPCPR